MSLKSSKSKTVTVAKPNTDPTAVSQADKVFTDLYTILYREIEGTIKRGALKIDNLDEVFRITMELVEWHSTYKGKLSGTQKSEIGRQLIVKIIKDLVKRKKVDPSVGRDAVAAINLLAPVIFKIACLAQKGGIAIGEFVKRKTAKCCM